MKLNTNLRFLEFGVITRRSIHDFEWLLFFQFQYWWYMFYYYWGTSSKYIAKNTQFLFRGNLLMQLTQRSATRLHYYKKNFLKIWLVIPKILKILNIGSKINSVARISYFNPVNKELSFFWTQSELFTSSTSLLSYERHFWKQRHFKRCMCFLRKDILGGALEVYVEDMNV